MVVQHNLRAMNSNRMLGLTTSSQAKSTEKLSSGFKINRAADDAAGLAISEKMRKQMRGLTQASANAQDGISSVQTAEGALTEVHDMLQRMNELATKAANGTMSENDRSYVQNEIDQLVTELDRVSETTKFNETYLLKGNAEGTTSQMTVNAHDAGLAGKLTDNGDGTSTFSLGKELADGDKVTIAGREYTIGVNNASTIKNHYVAEGDTDFAKTEMAIGDSIYDSSADKTYTLVGKVKNDDSVYKAGMTFTVTAANGEEVNYEIVAGASDEDHTGAVQKVTAANAEAIFNNALDAGSTVTLTKTADSKAVNFQVVKELDNGEVSGNKEVSALKDDGTLGVFHVNDATGAISFKTTAGMSDAFDEKDTVTLSGEKTVLTDAVPASRDAIDRIVDSLVKGEKVKLTSRNDVDSPTTAREFEIADETNEAAGLYTTTDLKKLIGDMDEVQFDVTTNNAKARALITAAGITPVAVGNYSDAFTATPNEKIPTGTDILSKSQAYDKMAEELQKASSIGTDVEATVKGDGNGNFTITQGTVEVIDRLDFNLHVGADADMTNKINVKIETMSAAGLGVKGLNVTDDTGMNATYAIDAIADAINKVSEQRSALGAVQNRLEHTINNLDNVVENTTAAESAIRDTDMANEMVKYSNDNILAQAGQAMLAQANQSNQGVLSLLQ